MKSKKRVCLKCRESKSLQCFERLQYGRPHSWCIQCVNTYYRNYKENHQESLNDTSGTGVFKTWTDVEKVQLVGMRAVMKAQLEDGDSIEQAFVNALGATNDDAAKKIDPKQLERFLRKYPQANEVK